MTERRPATRCTMHYLRLTHVAKIDHLRTEFYEGEVWDWWCELCDEGANDDLNSLSWREAFDLADRHARAHDQSEIDALLREMA